MGQRLNLEIKKGDKVLANCYYHWSAYTGSAFGLLREAHNYLSTHGKSNPKVAAIKALEYTGAGIYQDDWDYVESTKSLAMQNFPQATDRNRGLIAVTPKSIKNTQNWAEGTAAIDIDTMDVYFDVFNWYEADEDGLKELKEWNEDIDFTKCKHCKDLAKDFSLNYIDDLEILVDLVCSGEMVFDDDGYIIGEIG